MGGLFSKDPDNLSDFYPDEPVDPRYAHHDPFSDEDASTIEIPPSHLKELLHVAFEHINSDFDYIVAMPSWTCCDECGHKEALNWCHEHGKTGYIFWHRQDEDTFIEETCFLSFGSISPDPVDVSAIARECVRYLEGHRITVHWDGTAHSRIFVKI